MRRPPVDEAALEGEAYVAIFRSVPARPLFFYIRLVT